MSLSVCLLLDDRSDRAVRQLWRRLEDAGLTTLLSHTHGRHVPHLTLASLLSYDLDEVRAALTELPPREPTDLHLDALGMFRRSRCWLGPAASGEILDRQRAVVAAVETTGAQLHRNYRPGRVDAAPHPRSPAARRRPSGGRPAHLRGAAADGHPGPCRPRRHEHRRDPPAAAPGLKRPGWSSLSRPPTAPGPALRPRPARSPPGRTGPRRAAGPPRWNSSAARAESATNSSGRPSARARCARASSTAASHALPSQRAAESSASARCRWASATSPTSAQAIAAGTSSITSHSRQSSPRPAWPRPRSTAARRRDRVGAATIIVP